jgi:hypothetical protein
MMTRLISGAAALACTMIVSLHQAGAEVLCPEIAKLAHEPGRVPEEAFSFEGAREALTELRRYVDTEEKCDPTCYDFGQALNVFVTTGAVLRMQAIITAKELKIEMMRSRPNPRKLQRLRRERSVALNEFCAFMKHAVVLE